MAGAVTVMVTASAALSISPSLTVSANSSKGHRRARGDALVCTRRGGGRTIGRGRHRDGHRIRGAVDQPVIDGERKFQHPIRIPGQKHRRGEGGLRHAGIRQHGAVKVGCATRASDSTTLGPEVWVQA